MADHEVVYYLLIMISLRFAIRLLTRRGILSIWMTPEDSSEFSTYLSYSIINCFSSDVNVCSGCKAAIFYIPLIVDNIDMHYFWGKPHYMLRN